MKVAQIGCGVLGRKRIKAYPDNWELQVACDVLLERTENLLEGYSGYWRESSIERALGCKPDVAVISTPSHLLYQSAMACIKAGCHVLIEKPGVATADEAIAMQYYAKEYNVKVGVGFNHRWHPALMKAKRLCTDGLLGRLMHVRAHYGHGGRKGYEKDWRALPSGGELLDQGSHLIDLACWFLGSLTKAQGELISSYWAMPVEDNAFMLLSGCDGKVAQLHASWTEWVNEFRFEIFGTHGKLLINGLGGSYGLETLTYWSMEEIGVLPAATTYTYPGEDLSWKRELAAFNLALLEDRLPPVGLAEAIDAHSLMNKTFQYNQFVGSR